MDLLWTLELRFAPSLKAEVITAIGIMPDRHAEEASPRKRRLLFFDFKTQHEAQAAEKRVQKALKENDVYGIIYVMQ